MIDPYLSDHLTKKYATTARPHIRMTRAPLRGADLKTVDLLLSSHKHSDHLDPETLAEILSASAGAMLVVPESLLDHTAAIGLPAGRCMGIDAGCVIDRDGFRVRAIPSAHETIDSR